MIKHRTRRLACRFIVLVLAAAFVANSPDSASQKAAAEIPIPCRVCETMFNNCVANCGTLGNTFACLNQCANRYNTCLSSCS